MTWIIQQHDQTKASITLAPDFFDIILFVNLESNQKQTKANQQYDKIKSNFRRRILPAGLDCGEKKAVRAESMRSSR
jgi:hypothetical protein